jgi:homoserine O-acetyltransferase (EC 2.3.1.31)
VQKPVEHIEIDTIAGHDAFLVDIEQQAPIITEFLERLERIR